MELCRQNNNLQWHKHWQKLYWLSRDGLQACLNNNSDILPTFQEYQVFGNNNHFPLEALSNI